MTPIFFGCVTTDSGNRILGFPTHANACRNHHQILSSKNQRYKCVDIYASGAKYDGELINDFVRDGFGVYYYTNGAR